MAVPMLARVSRQMSLMSCLPLAALLLPPIPPSSCPHILQPLTEFDGQHWERQPLLCKATAERKAFLQGLYDVDALLEEAAKREVRHALEEGEEGHGSRFWGCMPVDVLWEADTGKVNTASQRRSSIASYVLCPHTWLCCNSCPRTLQKMRSMGT